MYAEDTYTSGSVVLLGVVILNSFMVCVYINAVKHRYTNIIFKNHIVMKILNKLLTYRMLPLC